MLTHPKIAGLLSSHKAVLNGRDLPQLISDDTASPSLYQQLWLRPRPHHER